MSDDGLELVMPFVTVQSKGGPHDDESYAAAWEMGALDARLAVEAPPFLETTIHTANTEQADLIAMKNGYKATIDVSDVDGWSHMTLTRNQA